jgi:hypothetical protein
MNFGCRFLLLSLAGCSMAGCLVVAGPGVRRSSEVIVYTVDSPPPPRPVGWRRSFVFRYYPACQVYYAPHRNCYIWKGPRGWITAQQPPPQVALNQSDSVTVELGNDDPADSHAEVMARCSNPQAPPPHASKGRDKDKDKGRHRGRDRDDD